MKPQNGAGVTKKRNGAAQERAILPEPRHEAARAAAGDDLDSRPHLARIAERAYFIYEQHGRQHGYDVEHWLQAERELRDSTAATATTTSPPARRNRTPSRRRSD